MNVHRKSSAPPPETPPGRGDLILRHQLLADALREEAELVALVTNLREAIQDGQRAENAAVAGLEAGRGASLPNAGELMTRVTNGALASKALPHSEQKLATAQSETARLRAAVVESAKQQLRNDASIELARYDAAAEALFAIYDRLVGIKGALLGEAGHRPLEIPTFRMVPGADIGIHKHGSLDSVGDPRRASLKSQSDWTRALDRLISDPLASLSDLIGTAVGETT